MLQVHTNAALSGPLEAAGTAVIIYWMEHNTGGGVLLPMAFEAKGRGVGKYGAEKEKHSSEYQKKKQQVLGMHFPVSGCTTHVSPQQTLVYCCLGGSRHI